ncbi:MAG: AAA family ATPase [Desulfovibrio sp.]
MKIAFAGKGGVGKTTLTAWTADYLARQGHNVWMVDADTALSLGMACGIERDSCPTPLIEREDLIRTHIGEGMMHLNPDVDHLPRTLALDVPICGSDPDGCSFGEKKLLVMGATTSAGGGCACKANALLKAVLSKMMMDDEDWVLIDLEAGVEHLGRGTVSAVDGLVVVSEPSYRGMDVAAQVGQMADDLGLTNQLLAINGCNGVPEIPNMSGLPEKRFSMPFVPELIQRQLASPSVLGLSSQAEIDTAVASMISSL